MNNKLGRPKTGKRTKTCGISLELSLLLKLDEYARMAGITRSRVIAKSLASFLKNKTNDSV